MTGVREDAAEMEQRNHASDHFWMGTLRWCLRKNGQKSWETWSLQVLP